MEFLQHVFQTVLGIWDDDQLEFLSHWLYYKGHLSLNDMHEQYHHNPVKTEKHEENKVNGVKEYLTSNIMQKIKLFTIWMSKEMKHGMCILHDEFLDSLTRDQFLEFRSEGNDFKPNSRSPPAETYTPKTTFTGHTRPPALSESQTTLNNCKRGKQRDASAYPIFKNDLYYDTFKAHS